jgi:hypothetical protein
MLQVQHGLQRGGQQRRDGRREAGAAPSDLFGSGACSGRRYVALMGLSLCVQDMHLGQVCRTATVQVWSARGSDCTVD